jgi:hypothetical protein
VRINCSLGRCEDGTVLHCIAWRCSATPRRDVQLAVGAAFFGSIRGSPSFSARVYKAELPSYETPLTDSLALARQPLHPAPSTQHPAPRILLRRCTVSSPGARRRYFLPHPSPSSTRSLSTHQRWRPLLERPTAPSCFGQSAAPARLTTPNHIVGLVRAPSAVSCAYTVHSSTTPPSPHLRRPCAARHARFSRDRVAGPYDIVV